MITQICRDRGTAEHFDFLHTLPSFMVNKYYYYYDENCDEITHQSYRLEIGSSSWLAWTSCRRTTTDRRTSSSRQTVTNRLCCVIQASDDSSDIFKLTSSSSRQHTHSSAVGITWHCPHMHQLLFSSLSVSALLLSRSFSSALLRYDDLSALLGSKL